ncbi:MAG: trigger factor [SAR202 cluster bacterium Io17-Chloro-G9]|nr:MAG: trigger factor [SAR202 cluster bacterium Io17-Chloro-G9]
MDVTKDSENPTEVTLNISMDTGDEEPFLGRSYSRLVSRLQIPGFRPGKAPRSIVENHVGRAALVQEALEFMIPETLDQVLKDHDLKAFSEPQLEIIEVEPVQFKAVVPLEPIVDLGDFRVIRLDRDPVEVTDQQVEEVLEQLQYEAAPWEPAERPAQFGDLLNINVTGTILGEPAIDDQGIDFIPQQDNPLPVPGFSIYLEGMTEGQDKDFSLTIPEDSAQTQYAGQECRLSVSVLSVKAKNLPTLDDEFAKGVRDGYDSLEDLRGDIRQRLTADGEASSLRQLEQSSLEELLKISTVQASDLVYQRELDMMREDRERAIRGQQLDMDTYLSYLGKSAEEWQEEMRPQAEERLKTYLVLRKLAEEEGIETSEEDVDAEIESLISNSRDAEDTIRQAVSNENARESLRSSLLNRKVMERLVGIVQGNEDGDDESTGGAVPESAAAEAATEESTTEETAAGELEATEEGAEPNAN